MKVSKSITAGFSKDKTGVAKTNKDGVSKSWPAGKIEMEVPDLESWTKEQRARFAQNAARHALQYGASTVFRNKAGKCPEAGVTTGEILWDAESGVMRFNPEFEVGADNNPKSEAQMEKLEKIVTSKVQAFELMKGRKITDSELEMIRFNYGI